MLLEMLGKNFSSKFYIFTWSGTGLEVNEENVIANRHEHFVSIASAGFNVPSEFDNQSLISTSCREILQLLDNVYSPGHFEGMFKNAF